MSTERKNPEELKKRFSVEPPKNSIIDKFGRDLTALARDGKLDVVIGRDEEIERVAQILSRRKKNNPVLIGEPGVGKTAIIEGLAKLIIENKVPSTLSGKRVVALDLAGLVAGTAFRGQFEERINGLIQELEKEKDVILFIDEIHTLIGAGAGNGSLDASNILKPALARGEFQCVGATTLNEFRQSIEKDGALDRRFQKVIVNPPSAEETITILMKSKEQYEKHHNVKFTDEAIELCVKMADRYITDRFFPDKALDIIDEVGSRVRIKNSGESQEILDMLEKHRSITKEKQKCVSASKFEEASDYLRIQKLLEKNIEQLKEEWKATEQERVCVVDEHSVAQVVSMMTGVPVSEVTADESKKLLTMEEDLKQQVIGQDEAVETVVRAIRRARVGLKDPKRPIGSFLFMGSTGVGKTELTKALARQLFNSEDALIRIDMSEFMEKHSVSKLIGAPPGYVGYGEGGQLTEKVRRKPFSIVLFDEVEKAHPEVFNTLLQVLDDGHLTDGNGRKVDFKNTVIIMTSNVGVREVKQTNRIGFSENVEEEKFQSMKGTIEESMRAFFSPEFLNRIDSTIVFKQLQKENMHKIIEIQLSNLLSRLEDKHITLELSEEAKDLIVNQGFDQKYGARPLKRVLQRLIEDKLAEEMLKETIGENSNVIVSVNDNKELVFKTTTKKAKSKNQRSKVSA
jgi:ATP-dependent Clp protease ATP-binding subunit ClpC